MQCEDISSMFSRSVKDQNIVNWETQISLGRHMHDYLGKMYCYPYDTPRGLN